MLRVAKAVFVAATVDTTIGHPAGPTVVAIRAQTSLLSHEAERVERRQPVKPLRSIGKKRKLSERWADDHVGANSRVCNEGKHAGTSSCVRREGRTALSTRFGRGKVCNGGLCKDWWRGMRSPGRLNERFQHAETLFRAKLALTE